MGDDVEVATEIESTAADAAPKSHADLDREARDAFMALEGDGADAQEPAGKPAPAKKPAPKTDPVEDDAEAVSDEDEDLEDVDLDEDDLDEPDDDAEADKADPELAKRLAKVRKREQHVREQQAQRDRSFETEKQAFVAEWKPRIEALEQFEKLKGRRDVVGVLKAIGFSEDDFEDLSKIVYGHSKAAAAEPKNREAVRRLQSERELREQATANERKIAELEARDAKRDADARVEREVAVYMGKVGKAVSEATPLVQKRLESRPTSTQKALNEIAHRLAVKNGGQLVEPAKVVKIYERKLERDRALYGDSQPTDAKKPGAIAKPVAGKKPAIEVVEAAPKKKPANIIPTRAEALEMIEKFERGELTLDDAD